MRMFALKAGLVACAASIILIVVLGGYFANRFSSQSGGSEYAVVIVICSFLQFWLHVGLAAVFVTAIDANTNRNANKRWDSERTPGAARAGGVSSRSSAPQAD